MNAYISIYEHKDEIRKAIDAREWKHSWHLPRDRYGYIDWSNPRTHEKCLEVLEGYAEQSILFAATCTKLCKVLREKVAFDKHMAEDA